MPTGLQPTAVKSMQPGERYLTQSNIEMEVVRIKGAQLFFVCPRTHEGKLITKPRNEWKEGTLSLDDTILAVKIDSKGGDIVSDKKAAEASPVEEKEEVKEKAPKAPKVKKEKTSKRHLFITGIRAKKSQETIIAEVMKAHSDLDEESAKKQYFIYKNYCKKDA